MSYTIVTLFSFSILIAATIGFIKFKHISNEFYPFIICTWIGSFNEILSTILDYVKGSDTINNNIYMLAEASLITWQFSRWRIFRNKKVLPVLILFLITGWMLGYYFITKATYLFYFSILYCLLIVLLAIETSVKLIITFQGKLVRNPRFIICCGFIIYFTFRILIESSWYFGLSESKAFRNEVYYTMIWINLFVNVLFCFAFLWIPRKPQFITTLSLPVS